MQTNRGHWIGTLCGLVMLGGMAVSVRGQQDTFGDIQRRGTVIVTPRRPTIVQVCFDMLQLRPAVMVCYEVIPHRADPVLHVWDATTKEWKPMSLAHYQSGNFITFRPIRTILIGTDTELPSALADIAAWGGTISRINRLSLADMMNAFDRDLDFSADEWQWLARRYKLQLRDLNTNRRRYGRYGRPDNVSEPAIEIWEPPAPAAVAPAAASDAPVREAAGAYEEALAPAVVTHGAGRASDGGVNDERLPNMKAPAPVIQDVTTP